LNPVEVDLPGRYRLGPHPQCLPDVRALVPEVALTVVMQLVLAKCDDSSGDAVRLMDGHVVQLLDAQT
jgi:hypothetical protein